MEEQEIKKPRKAKTEPQEILSTRDRIEALKAEPTSFPLQKAVFHNAIMTSKNEPETALFLFGAHKPSRLAKMWYTRLGILIEQKNLKGQVETKIVHQANAYDTLIFMGEE